MITVYQFVSRFLDKNSLVATLILLSGSPYLEKFAGSELNLSFFCIESFSTGVNFGLLRYWMAFSLIIWLYSELEVPEWQFWSGFHITLGSNGSISAFFSILGWGYKSSFATKLIPISRNCRIWGHSSFRDRHIFSIKLQVNYIQGMSFFFLLFEPSWIPRVNREVIFIEVCIS